MAEQDQHIEGKSFDKPLSFSGAIDGEPQSYIAERPYDLTKYEFSILRKCKPDSLFLTVLGATIGLAISILGKVINALIDKNSPTFEAWEIYAVCLGLFLLLITKCVLKFFPSKEHMERKKLEEVIDGQFQKTKLRRVHLTPGDDQ